MNSWKEMLEKMFSAVAFAEAGEQKTAIEIAGITPSAATQTAGILSTFNKAFAAVAFAEEGCHDVAAGIVNRKPTFAEVIGLQGVRVWQATAPATSENFLEAIGLGARGVRFGIVSI
jgi:hypothetical protein